MQTAAAQKPFLPSDLDPSRALTRAMTGHVLQEMRNERGSAEPIVTRAWPRDLHAKAATSPTTTSGAAALQPAIVGGFVSGLVPQSAAAKLMAAGIKVDLDGVGTVSIPRASNNPLPPFVDEAAPIPVMQPTLSAGVVGPAKKMSMIQALTAELEAYSAENAEQVIRTLMQEAAAKALDGAVFSAAAASSSRPAGILNGAPSLTATTGGGLAALAGDVSAVIGSIVSGGGGNNIAFVADPATAARLTLYAPAGFGFPVWATTALAAKTLVGVEIDGFASGFGPEPTIETSNAMTVHFEDTTPLQISTPGSPNTVAAPVRSMYQTSSYGLRLTLRCAWAMRAPNLVAQVLNVTW